MKKFFLLFCLLFFIACGGGNSEISIDKNEKNSSVEMKDEQVLNLFLGAEPKSLDISRSTDIYSSNILVLTNEGLVSAEKNEAGQEVIIPGVAKSWTVSDDGLIWTFKLRNNAVWADNKPVTAKNFYYGITRTLSPEIGSSYAYLLYPIKGAKAYNGGKGSLEDVGIKVIDEHTIQFTLENPTPYFLQLAYGKIMYPQREDIVNRYGVSYGSEGEQILSNGPYKITEWIHNNKIVVEKNPNYWNNKEYKLDKINMMVVNDENSRMNLMASGQIDIGYSDKPEWIKKFMDSGDFKNRKIYSLGTNYATFNTTSKYFKNEKIRKAFSLAINREEINKVMFNGNFDPAYGFVSKGINIGSREYRSIVPEPLKKLKTENPNPKKLLSEGLKELGFDPNPEKMTITYLSSGTSSWSRKYSELLQQMLKTNLGVNIKAEFVEWPVYQKRTNELDYEIGGQSMSGDFDDPNTFLEVWTSYANQVPTGWSNPEYDKLIQKTYETSDENLRAKYFEKAENILLYKESVIAPTLYRVTNTYYRNYVKNYNPTTVAPYSYRGVYIKGRE